MEFSGEKMRQARGDRSQADVCLTLSLLLERPVATQQYSAWESGTNKPSAKNLPALAQALGVTINDLYA